MTDPASDNQTTEDRRPMRHEGWPAPLFIGLAVVAVGVIFLARNFGLYLPLPERWWAIAILLPAGAALVSAARFYRLDGGISARVTGAATAGTLILATALILFLDLEWDQLWPVMVIIVGLGITAAGRITVGDRRAARPPRWCF